MAHRDRAGADRCRRERGDDGIHRARRRRPPLARRPRRRGAPRRPRRPGDPHPRLDRFRHRGDPMTSPLLWYLNRGTGVVLLVLFSATVVLGVLATGRSATPLWPRFVTQGLHRSLAALSVL